MPIGNRIGNLGGGYVVGLDFYSVEVAKKQVWG
jgi:hypothetical protein